MPKDAVFLYGADMMSMNDLFCGIDAIINALYARPKAIKELHVAHNGPVRPVLSLRELKRSYDKGQQQLNLL